ncbi:MAG: TlpA family protein disulfide reductase [Bacteroidetes bacterium]|nr:MAG: TlpA family protein disulfide reductase [Bacteroidota bacterium]
MDTFQGRKYYRPIGFRHPFVPKVSIHIFFIDTGTTFIETYTSKFHPLNSTTLFSGSVQNIPYFKDVYLRYPDSAISDRKGIIDANTIKIQRWPNSYFLLEQLFTYRNYFTREELEAQLARFSDVIKKSAKFRLLTQSSSNKNNFDNTYPAGIKLLTPSGEFRTMGRSTAATSLIVFWASWCGPCRKEIPLLKKLYAQHKGNGFEIMSISMDANQANWQIALRQEEMPWAQFLLTDSSREFVKVNYELSAIPKSYLFDKNGILVERFLGLEDTIKMYKALKEVLK